MSYNIDTIDYIGDGKLSIRRADAVKLQRELKNELAEGNLFEELDLDGDDEILVIEKPWWYGESSGTFYEDVFVGKILPTTRGHAQLLIVWEGGDSMSGLEIKDGVVTEKKVSHKLE